jgi:hypothetical protein
MSDSPEKSALGHVAPKKRQVKPSLPKMAMSLKPGMQLMGLLLLPNPTERVLAIQDAWKFRFPVTQATERVANTGENTGEIIFAPDQETSRGKHRYATLAEIAAVVGDDGSVDFEYDSI